MSDTELLHVAPLSAGAFEPYGWMLGEPYDPKGTIPGFSNAATDFWQTHVFDPGMGGSTEVLWVNYRSHEEVAVLEVHRLTQQAIVPLTGSIIHIVATSLADGCADRLHGLHLHPGDVGLGRETGAVFDLRRRIFGAGRW